MEVSKAPESGPEDPIVQIIDEIDSLFEPHHSGKLGLYTLVDTCRSVILAVDEVLTVEVVDDEVELPQRIKDLLIARDMVEAALTTWTEDWETALYEQLVAGTVFLRHAQGDLKELH